MMVGPMEIGLFVLLGVLLLLALASLAVAVMFAFAVTLAPVMAGVADRVRRLRWRNWHPPTDWLPDLDAELGCSEGAPPRASGVAVVSSRQLGTNVDLLTAQVPAQGQAVGHSTVTAVHATLAPDSRLDLPEDAHAEVAVLVVSGTGTLGSGQRVGAGDVAFIEPGEPVSLMGGDDHGARAMEVLVLGGVPCPADAREHAAQTDHDPASPHDATPADAVTQPTPGPTPAPTPAPAPAPVPMPALSRARALGRRGRPAAV
jgi:quercetin dioxygenase-like cupin family protein